MVRTLKSSREIDSLFNRGRRAANKYVVVLAGRTPEGRGPEGRVAFIAGKKTGGAVSRNRSKRVLRASVSRRHCEWPGWDVALIARKETGSVDCAALDDAINDALTRAGVQDA